MRLVPLLWVAACTRPATDTPACDSGDSAPEGIVIDGDVTVTHADDLAALEGVVGITGTLHIEAFADPEVRVIDLGGLTALGGLDVLESSHLVLLAIPDVTSLSLDLEVQSSLQLTHLDLTGLTDVAGNITLAGTGLTSVEGLTHLQRVGGDLSIGANPHLEHVDLEELTSVGALALSHNPDLTHPHLPVLTTLDRLRVSDLESQTDWMWLSPLTEVTGSADLSCAACPSLNGIWFATPSLHIHGHDQIETLTGLRASVDQLVIEDNPRLHSLFALPVESLDGLGDLTVANNDALVDFDGAKGLTSLRKLEVWGNDRLASMDGLQDLHHIESELGIHDNPALPQCLVDAWVAQLDAESTTSSNLGNNASCE